MSGLARIGRFAKLVSASFGTRRKPFVRPHHYLHFELVPGYRSDDGSATHNSLGFRGREFTRDKPPGTLRIACLGESTTYCAGIADDETWPARLQVKLAAANRRPVEVINAGVPAYVSSEVLLSYIFKVEDLKPDWLIYYFTINDVRPRQIGVVSRDYREFCRRWGEKPQIRTIDQLRIYLRFRHSINYTARNMLHVSHPESNILKTTEAVFRSNLRDLVALGVANGSKVLLVCPRYRNLTGEAADLTNEDPMARAVAEHRSAVAAIGAELSQPVLDMMKLMPRPPLSGPDEDGFYLDGIHMSAKGADVFASHLADALRAQPDFMEPGQ